MKKTIFLVAIGFALLLNTVSGQNDPFFSAWMETQATDGNLAISCWAQNKSAKPVQLGYTAILTMDGNREIKEGSTLALPNQPSLLLKGIFVIPDGIFDNLRLEVFDQQKLVATASLNGPPKQEAQPTPELLDTPPLTVKKNPLEALEIEGLILDETRSKLAHDFYELFYNGWTDVEGSIGSYTVTIRELPNRIGIGSRISVGVDGEEITQLNLQPRMDVIEDLAAQLVEALKNHLENPENIKGIEIEDLNGSGIY